MKQINFFRQAIWVAAIFATTALTAQTVYKGLRVPQLTTGERANIGAESIGTPAAGQQVFNLTTGQMEYFDGTKWVIVSNGVNVTSNDSTVTVVGSGTSEVDLSVNAQEVAGALANYISNTMLGDSILNYIAQNIDNPEYSVGETVQQYITDYFSVELGDTILNYIANNFPVELGSTVLEYITNNVTRELTDSIMANVTVTGTGGVVVTGSGTSAINVALPSASAANDVLTWNGTTWEAKGIGAITTNGTVTSVTSGVSGLTFGVNSSATPMLDINGSPSTGQFLAHDGTWQTPANDNTTYTADENSLMLNGTEFSVKDLGISTGKIADNAVTNAKIAENAIDSVNIKDGSVALAHLRPGDSTGQIIQWDGTKWILATAASVVKKVTIDINSGSSIQSIFWQGTTGASSSPVEVVGMEPVITSSEGDAFINHNLTISTSAKVVSGAIAYTLKVRNENIDSAKKFTVNAINIYYTCNDTLTAGATPVSGTFAGQ